jgi:hypothetical protein
MIVDERLISDFVDIQVRYEKWDIPFQQSIDLLRNRLSVKQKQRKITDFMKKV